jgi:ring-1,2-phenylacetyl-CoA epoxidase subunit PaaD
LLPVLPVAPCPYCGSLDTTIENAFGPTLCRAIYHCSACRQPFEQFKTV